MFAEQTLGTLGEAGCKSLHSTDGHNHLIQLGLDPCNLVL